MFGIGIQEFGLILVVALLVFGPKKLPELARMLGRGLGEFRRASNDLRQSLALDDLQNDLRKDLHSAQSMLKPDLKSALKTDSANDRPPQAGDELGSHPGELPLGHDHDHHPETASETSENEDALAATAAGSEASHEPASDASEAPRTSAQSERRTTETERG